MQQWNFRDNPRSVVTKNPSRGAWYLGHGNLKRDVPVAIQLKRCRDMTFSPSLRRFMTPATTFYFTETTLVEH